MVPVGGREQLALGHDLDGRDRGRGTEADLALALQREPALGRGQGTDLAIALDTEGVGGDVRVVAGRRGRDGRDVGADERTDADGGGRTAAPPRAANALFLGWARVGVDVACMTGSPSTPSGGLFRRSGRHARSRGGTAEHRAPPYPNGVGRLKGADRYVRRALPHARTGWSPARRERSNTRRPMNGRNDACPAPITVPDGAVRVVDRISFESLVSFDALVRWFDGSAVMRRSRYVRVSGAPTHSGDERTRADRGDRADRLVRLDRRSPRLGDPDGAPGPRPVPRGREPRCRHVSVDRRASRVGRTDRRADRARSAASAAVVGLDVRLRAVPGPGPSAGCGPAQAARAPAETACRRTLHSATEVPLPIAGDQRAWDGLSWSAWTVDGPAPASSMRTPDSSTSRPSTDGCIALRSSVDAVLSDALVPARRRRPTSGRRLPGIARGRPARPGRIPGSDVLLDRSLVSGPTRAARGRRAPVPSVPCRGHPRPGARRSILLVSTAQPSRSRRPGRSSSQVRRWRRRRGWSGGSTVHGWSASTTGPSRAARASVMWRASVQLLARAGFGQRGAGRQVRPGRGPSSAGRTREAIRRPTYSSSVPAMARGTIGGSDAQGDDRPARRGTPRVDPAAR